MIIRYENIGLQLFSVFSKRRFQDHQWQLIIGKYDPQSTEQNYGSFVLIVL